MNPLIRRPLSRVTIGISLAVIGCVAVFAIAAQASATHPPTVVITSPKEGEVVTEPTVTVKGDVTVAGQNGPGTPVTITLNGHNLRPDVRGSVKYDFEGTVTLKKGPNELTVTVDDGDGGRTSQTVTVKYAPVMPTKSQCVSDRAGDSRDHFTHMDVVRACARRQGGRVIFSVTTAHAPPHMHDGFGNPAAPCIEYSKGEKVEPHITPIQSCGDARLRGWTMRHWPKVPFSIGGRVSKWKVPLKYLSKSSFQWRAYVADGWNYADKAPNKGYLIFVVK
jgi:hypothetical protein